MWLPAGCVSCVGIGIMLKRDVVFQFLVTFVAGLRVLFAEVLS